MNNKFGLGFYIGSFGLSSQKLINSQQQSLLYSYETLGNLLSSAENFVGLRNEQYSQYNISTANSYDELKSEFAWELHCFQLALRKYKQKYGPYIFPDSCPKEKIIYDCKRYINRTKNEKDKILFYSMINIINGDKVDIDFDKLFEELDNNFADKKFNPSKLAKLIGPLNYLLDQIGKDAEEGKISFNNDDNRKTKIKELLKKKSQSDELINVIYGKEGYLSKNKNNKFNFISENNSDRCTISIDEKINLNIQRLYSAKKGDHEIKVYIEKYENSIGYFCSLFENDIKQCSLSDIQFINKQIGYGYYHLNSNIRFPILIEEEA
jgi:hypothetical protein